MSLRSCHKFGLADQKKIDPKPVAIIVSKLVYFGIAETLYSRLRSI
jgi:hypothetical protein